MKAMLEQEPQVAIFAHLSRWLTQTGQLIPQQVEIDAWLSDNQEAQPAIHLGSIFKLNRQTADEIGTGNTRSLTGQLQIPTYPASCTALKFTTDIQVYRNHCLTERQCSLNLPRVIKNAYPATGSTLNFSYCQGAYPSFHFDYVQALSEADGPLCDSFDTTLLGILHLKRLWQKAQKNKKRQLDRQRYKQEWPLDIQLMNALPGNSADITQQLYQCDSSEAFTRWLHTQSPEPITLTHVNRINKTLYQTVKAFAESHSDT